MSIRTITKKGSGTVGGEGGFSDSFAIAIGLADSSAVPTDDATFALALAQSDTVAEQTETLRLAFPTPDFEETSAVPTDAKSILMKVWYSASAGTGTTNPTFADGANNATVATVTTAVANPATETLTSTLGANVPTVAVTSVIYRGWFKSVNVLATSTGKITLHSLTAAFADIIIFTNSATSTTVDHLTNAFTYDLIANGINTLAKIQSVQVLHTVTDAAAGVTPHILTVDAGCLEIEGAFT